MNDELETLRADRDAMAREVLSWRTALSQVATHLLDEVVARTDATGAMQRYLADRAKSVDPEGAD